MNLQQLRVFVLTVQKERLTEVAGALHIQQPTVSFHLDRLQKELGVQLFAQHSSRHLILTDAGEDLYHYALQIVAHADEAEQLMEDYRSLQRGRLKLGSSYTPASYILPPYLASFRQQHGGLRISLMVKKAPSILRRVKNFELDIGVIAYDHLHDDELESIPVLDDELVLAIHPHHPLVQVREVTPRMLADFPFILHEPEAVSRRLVEKWAAENGIRLNMIMEISANQTIKEAVKANIGLAVLPKLSVRREIESGELIARPLPNYHNERFIYIIYRRNRIFTPLVEEFLPFAIQALRDEKPTNSNMMKMS